MNIFTSTFPPLVFVLGPWLLLGLVLSGPFLVLLTVFAVAAALPATLMLPFVLLHGRRARRAPAAATPRVAVELKRVTA